MRKMKVYVVLLRGINVGGKNKIPMAVLKQRLEEQGFEVVATYIQSGNIILLSNLDAHRLSAKIEDTITRNFTLDSTSIKVLALDDVAFKAIVAQAPKKFGKDPSHYRYDIIFLMGVSSTDAMQHIDVHAGIDEAWRGERVVYCRRPSLTNPNATKSHLGKIAQTPLYPSITIRNWNTTTKLLTILKEHEQQGA